MRDSNCLSPTSPLILFSSAIALSTLAFGHAEGQQPDLGQTPTVATGDETLSSIYRQWRHPKLSARGGLGQPMDNTQLISTKADLIQAPYGEVWQFYADQCGHPEKYEDKLYQRHGGRHGKVDYLIFDQIARTKKERRYSTFVYRAPTHVVTVVLWPSPDNADKTLCQIAMVLGPLDRPQPEPPTAAQESID